ncbi:MAG: Hpt domain-containing protein [Wujia sp.]
MVLAQCYEAFGGDFEAVKQRIPKEEMIERFVRKFLTEPSYQNLCDTLDRDDYVEAFRAAHSLKGISANLGFDKLETSSSELTELLRNSEERQVDKAAAMEKLVQVTRDYNVVVQAIKQYIES